ncbi:dTDP-4-dehydrorhamnose 3,5-epimerase [Pseudothioglobus sp. nBUS_23]|uniref:dTDP-4-dehydrorhamnose 3,5-epimerase n=1 Tax=Pseudothioglobus sp. nBUS_23 TaxID=3395318 RepID=UPI003EB8C606
MHFIAQSIPEVLVIEPLVHFDERGYFIESFRQDLLEKKLGYQVNFIQDNESKSNQMGILRGLHYQIAPFTQSKLVRVSKGRVLDVAVDIRKDSATFGKYVAVELSDQNKRQVFIPKGFAHGFVVLSEDAIFSYKVDQYYSKKHERGLIFNDKDINIDWHISEEELILSVADQGYSSLKNNQFLL